MTVAAFIVIWRATDNDGWHVQPHVHDFARASRVGSELVNRFGGTAWALPIELPTGEDAKD